MISTYKSEKIEFKQKNNVLMQDRMKRKFNSINI